MRAGRTLAVLLAALAATVDARAQRPISPADSQQRLAILDLEDRRASDREFQALLAGVESLSLDMRLLLIRAIGRLERPSLVPFISGFLTSRNTAIRAETATALAQALHGEKPDTDAVQAVHRLLLDALKLEREDGDPGAREAIALSLGRLPYFNAQQVEGSDAAILAVLRTAQRIGSDSMLRSACVAFESLIRMHRRLREPPQETLDALKTIVTSHVRDKEARPAAMAALVAASAVDIDLIDRALSDPDSVEVRRLAAGAMRAFAEERSDLLDRALRERAAAVRYEALRVYGANPFAGCGRIVDALADPSEHVVLLAIDLLGGPCTSDPGVGDVLSAYTTGVGQLANWQRGAHALVAMASRDPRRAADAMPLFAKHLTPQARVYAARAAITLEDLDRLKMLAEDSDDNVRQAAIVGLHLLKRHEADEIYIQNLARRDYQLLMTAVAALQGTPLKEAASGALFDALARVTAEKNETSREVRILMLQRLRELGHPLNAPGLKPYIADFDPKVAAEAADLYFAWTDTRLAIDPEPLPRPPLPTLAELLGLRGKCGMLYTRTGSICLALRVDEAPLAAARFARLVQSKYYDRATFHRATPNFLLQGGSPSANDYPGHARYWRDEVGLPHTRGAVGISTRGRDTGDGQIFIDLADNRWLTWEYTVFAYVQESGGDVLDRILEGDQILRIEIAPPRLEKGERRKGRDDQRGDLIKRQQEAIERSPDAKKQHGDHRVKK